MANYRLNEEEIFADITDGVAIAVNSDTGVYYGMNEFGTSVFENIINGVSTDDVLAAIKKLDGAPADIEEKFNAFVQSLLDLKVIIEGGSGGAAANIIAANDFALEAKEYLDAQELLFTDPVYQVKEEIGWSLDKSAIKNDEADAVKTRREK